jgi:hypothetical protein
MHGWGILVVILIIIFVLIGLMMTQIGAITGGSSRVSPNIVVDTLNLAHWLFKPKHGLTPDLIVDAIDRTAPVLQKKHSGRIMYVLKDRESQFNDAEIRDKYRKAAIRNKAYLFVAERYEDPPQSSAVASGHSRLGRDDFYMSLLAGKNKCAVITADRLRDFSRFRDTIPPFRAYEYNYWRQMPIEDFIRPSSQAYASLRKPITIHPAKYFSA